MLNNTSFHEYCSSASWYRSGLKVLVACSGGADSTVLLHLLRKLPDIQISIVHFDHQLRGTDSDGDRIFVEELAQLLGHPVYVISENIGDLSSETGLSVEEVGSLRRRSTFISLKDELEYDFVATGQHLDDQIETVLIKLYQGSGIQGLSGISENKKGFIRPLLSFSQEEILAYATDLHLKYRTDASNSDISFLRNNIRANIIPELTENNDLDLRASIKSIIQAGQSLNGLIETSIEDVDIKEFSTYYAPKIALGMRNLPDYFSPIQKAIFDRAFQLISLMPQGISSNHFKALKSLFRDEAIGKEIQLPISVTACRDREGITLYKKINYTWSQGEISNTDRSKFPFFSFECISATLENHIQNPSYFWNLHDPEAYVVRHVESGDRIVVDASGRSISVNQVLQSARVAPFLKENFPVLEYQGEILWIPGIRTAYLAMVSETVVNENVKKHCIKVQFQKGTFE